MGKMCTHYDHALLYKNAYTNRAGLAGLRISPLKKNGLMEMIQSLAFKELGNNISANLRPSMMQTVFLAGQ